jgi:polysaccharide biosynthesis protein PelG
MAGIGFELRKILQRGYIFSTVRAYLYAGIISSGPWIISVITLVCIYLFLLKAHRSSQLILLQFQISITYAIAISLIISSVVQYSFTRYISDRLFEKQTNRILPNTIGILISVSVLSLIIGLILYWTLFAGTPIAYRFLMIETIIVLGNIWILANLLSGLRCYRTILFSFLIGYGLSFILCWVWGTHGIIGLIAGYFLGQACLLFLFIILITHNYFDPNYLDFDFARPKRSYYSLVFSGFFFNLAIWIDKFLFWFYPTTGQRVIGQLHASLVYDLPMYLSFFILIPGLAVFLMRMETDFVEYYQQYYDAIRDGASLTQIEQAHGQMVIAARIGLMDIIKVQFIFSLAVFCFAKNILQALSLPVIHAHLLRLDVIAMDLLIIFIAVINLNFYLDKRKHCLLLTGIFLLTNLIFTFITLKLGLFYYGYGLILSLIIADCLGYYLMNESFNSLTFKTFMQ